MEKTEKQFLLKIEDLENSIDTNNYNDFLTQYRNLVTSHRDLVSEKIMSGIELKLLAYKRAFTKKNDNIKDVCYWYQASRDQRTHEVERELGLSGTMGYEKMGCYNHTKLECSKEHTSCEHSTNLEEVISDKYV